MWKLLCIGVVAVEAVALGASPLTLGIEALGGAAGTMAGVILVNELNDVLTHLIHASLGWRAERGERTSLGTEGRPWMPCPLTRSPGKGALEGLISPQTWGRDIAPLPVVASPTTPPRG